MRKKIQQVLLMQLLNLWLIFVSNCDDNDSSSSKDVLNIKKNWVDESIRNKIKVDTIDSLILTLGEFHSPA